MNRHCLQPIRLRLAALLPVLLATLLWPSPALAQGLPMMRLDSRAKPPPDGNGFGFAVAVSSRYVVVGEPYAGDEAFYAGGAQVFDAVTGRFLRRIKSSGAANGQFGISVAVCGDLAVIGAPGENGGLGAAHLFDLRNGRRLRSFTASDVAAGDHFGDAVAINHDRVIVGAFLHNGGHGAVYVFDRETGGGALQKLTPLVSNPGDHFGASLSLSGRLLLVGALNHNNQRGAAYVFDLLRPPPFLFEIFKLSAPDGADGDEFGVSVAIDGMNALVGAWGHNSGRGAAYQFDLSASPSPVMIRKLTAPGASPDDSFGSAVALDGYQAAVGAYGRDSNRGAAYLFNLRNGDLLAALQAADGKAEDFFGYSLALHGSTLAVGAFQPGFMPDMMAGRPGHVYLAPQVARPLPLATIAQRGGSAPGIGGAFFGGLGDAFVTDDGYALFASGLTGSVTGNGRNFGVWAHWLDGILLRLLQRGVVLGPDAGGSTPNARVNRVEQIVSAKSDLKWLRVTLTGPGVNRSNNTGWFVAGGIPTAASYFRVGETLFPFNGPVFNALPDLVHSTTHTAVSYRFRRGVSGVDQSNDSGTLGMSNEGPVNDIIPREGLDLGGGERLGESFGRVSAARAAAFYGFGAHTYLQDTGAPPLRKVFLRFIGGSAPAAVAAEGDIAPNLGGFERFSAFVGETNAAAGLLIFRATLQPDAVNGVSRDNNEGIWHQSRGLVVRKSGEVVPGEEEVVFSRFLGFWPCGPDRVLIHAIAKGRGVNASNDGGLWLWDYDGGAFSLQTLLREGDALPYPDCPRVRVIQRVDADAESGRYTVLVSLTGRSNANQALLTGHASAGNTVLLRALRLPAPRLRKGMLVQAALGSAARFNRLALSITTDKTGAGGKGRSQVINETGQIMLRAGYTGGASEILTGRP